MLNIHILMHFWIILISLDFSTFFILNNIRDESRLPLFIQNDLFSHNMILFALDSEESARREITIFFKDFNIRDWYDNEELFYNLGKLRFDPTSFVHTIDKSYIELQNKQIME